VVALAASATAPSAEQRPATADVVLRPTNHPIVPADLAQLWLAPDKSRTARTAALEELAQAVKLEVDSNFAKALPILSRPSVQQGTLGHYALYYKGFAELRLGRPAEARITFRALAERGPVGYLTEAVALREAECAEALGDYAAAQAIYAHLSTIKTTMPEDVLMRLGRAAKAAGDRGAAAAAFARVYYEFPLSVSSLLASAELDNLPTYGPLAPANVRYKRELGRAERLYSSKHYLEARAAFENLKRTAEGDDRELVAIRIAECEYFLKRPRLARDGLKPFIGSASRQGEALFFYAVATRELGDEAEYLRTIRRIVADFATQTWSEEALNNLATHFLLKDDETTADQIFRELYAKAPSGRYADRAAMKVGWWAYKNGWYPDAIRMFERASADFPRSDYRPRWLYWAARAHDALQQPALAEARYKLIVADYLNSYYGRLAMKRLDGHQPINRVVLDQPAPIGVGSSGTRAGESVPPIPLPPSAPIVRALLALKLYDQAVDELNYARKTWGSSAVIDATTAWIYHQQGQRETGTRQFSLLRGAITTMRRAYPQFLAAGGESLPRDLLKVIFPLDYWDLIRKHAAQRNLDPFLVAALVAQESTFVPDIRSSANAVGLMQLIPGTAKRYARALKMRYSPKLLTNPEANVRMGTAYLADLIKEFGQPHLVLASYNAGEGAVRRWLNERPTAALDEFIDDIPYPETQNYVKRILGTAEDYRRLYGPDTKTAEVDAVLPAAVAPVVRSVDAPAQVAASRLKPTPADGKASVKVYKKKASVKVYTKKASVKKVVVKKVVVKNTVAPKPRKDRVNAQSGTS
jgi:soluble lytic murein transglycosylase